jgi:hypothetical protein
MKSSEEGMKRRIESLRMASTMYTTVVVDIQVAGAEGVECWGIPLVIPLN